MVAVRKQTGVLVFCCCRGSYVRTGAVLLIDVRTGKNLVSDSENVCSLDINTRFFRGIQ